MRKLLSLCILVSTFAFAENDVNNSEINEVDCLVIEQENSIICKYMNTRQDEDRFVNFEWVDPNGNISRSRKMLVPSGHGSVYDFRYLSGRAPGVWKFQVIDSGMTYTTEFEVVNK